MSDAALGQPRQKLLRRGRRLEVFTVLWNSAEGVVGLTLGLLAGSIALVGFSVDSFIEMMPLLSRKKRRVAAALHSRALAADSLQTDVCTYLSAILLGGLTANALWGWWWADPLAALAMTPFITREGWEALQGETDDNASARRS